MTFTDYILIHAGGSAVIFLLIWLERQWCLAQGKRGDAFTLGPALLVTLLWPIMLAFLPFFGLGYAVGYLWDQPVLFKKKKENKACPYKGKN